MELSVLLESRLSSFSQYTALSGNLGSHICCQLHTSLCHQKRQQAIVRYVNVSWYQHTTTKTSTIICTGIAVSAGLVHYDEWIEMIQNKTYPQISRPNKGKYVKSMRCFMNICQNLLLQDLNTRWLKSSLLTF